MLTLMSVDQGEATPLYMGQITRILRELAATSPAEFNYNAFKGALESCTLTWSQRIPLQQRLGLLESFLDLEDSAMDYNFEAGSLTIIDLSCPFVDANTACVLFDICMGLYLEFDPTIGKIIAMDEAHKVRFFLMNFWLSPIPFFFPSLQSLPKILSISRTLQPQRS
jgi:hypothetical protein